MTVLLDKFVKCYDGKKPVFPPESDEGFVEYKLRLDQYDNQRSVKIRSQMKFRMQESKLLTGKYIVYYLVGVDDDGNTGYISKEILENSLCVLQKLVSDCNFKIVQIEKHEVELDDNSQKYFALVELSKIKKQFNETCIGFVGPCNHGKTTSISVLTYNDKDNGNGSGRASVLKHFHEQSSGHTSSIKHDIIGILENGKIKNYRSNVSCSWESIVECSNNIISLFDLPGSNKFIKTSLSGILTNKPKYIVIVIDINRFSFEFSDVLFYINLVVFMNIKFIILFTKIDELQSLLLMDDLMNEYINKIKDYVFINDYLVGYFPVSNITHFGYDKFTELLSSLTTNPLSFAKNSSINHHKETNEEDHNDNIDFIINNVYNIPENGNIVSGILLYGTIKIFDKLFIGPYCGEYYPVTINSIYRKEIEYDSINKNELGSLGLKFNENIQLNKSMSVINSKILDSLFNITKDDEFTIKFHNNSQCVFTDDNEGPIFTKTLDVFQLNHQYMLYVDNMLLPIIVASIPDTNIVKFQFSKQMMGKKIYLRNKSKCIIKCDSNKEIYAFGEII